jgi:hypothetical protein
MLTPKIKSRIKKTTAFVKEHQTLVACAATAAITYKITNGVATKSAYGEVADLVYEYGLEAGRNDVFAMMVNDYLNHKGLAHEFMEFATPKA